MTIEEMLELFEGLGDEEIFDIIDGLPPHVINQLVPNTEKAAFVEVPQTPLAQAQELDEGYQVRAHLRYLSDRIAAAVKDVEDGHNRYMRVSMPPRMGKSFLGSNYTPSWMLRRHPDWTLGLISHEPTLAVNWGRNVRRIIEQNSSSWDVELARDAGAAAEWQTTKGGGVVSRSTGQSITGRGFKVMIIDDAVKDFADAHSGTKRNALWDWWLANAFTRLEAPYLVIVIGTRWHEDDLLGRLQSTDHEGDPADWEVVEFPAIAEENDVLGRAPGEPLYSPILEESEEEALERWATIKRMVGTYAWSALYQQRPAPSKGAIFDTDWWKFWTRVPQLASKDSDGKPDPDGPIRYIDPEEDLKSARWMDSWDMAFKDTKDSDYVVGQRWAQKGSTRYLIYQERARLTYTKTLERMKRWCLRSGTIPGSRFVNERLVEDKANGTAIIDSLKEEIRGIIPINPTNSKEARARAVTPDVESGHVRIPLPGEPGNDWVQDFLSEFREFPTGAHDDQVDATTQALSRMRSSVRSSVTQPSKVRAMPNQRRGQTAHTVRRVTGKGPGRRAG